METFNPSQKQCNLEKDSLYCTTVRGKLTKIIQKQKGSAHLEETENSSGNCHSYLFNHLKFKMDK